MKHLFWVVLVLVIAVLGVYFQYTNFKAADRQAALELTRSEQKRKALENTILNVARLEGTRISTSLTLTSTEGNSELRDLLTDTVLVFKFNTNDCADCSHEQFSFLKQFKDQFPSLRIIVLYEMANINAFKIERRLFFAPDKFYGVTKFDIPEQCYFLLDKDGHATNFFLPSMGNTELTKQYLKIIATRHFTE